MRNEGGINVLCFGDGVMGGARCGLVADVRRANRFLALELMERNCLGDGMMILKRIFIKRFMI
jgi:hypothetical protein